MRIPEEKVQRIIQLKCEQGLGARVVAERLGVSERIVYYIVKAAKQRANKAIVDAQLGAVSGNVSSEAGRRTTI